MNSHSKSYLIENVLIGKKMCVVFHKNGSIVKYYYLMCLNKYYILIFLKTKLLNNPRDLDLLHKSSIWKQNINKYNKIN